MNDTTMHVVVWDPSGEYWEGALVPPETGRVLQARAVATLPVEPRLLRRSAVGGYFRRSWGSGWPIGTAVPKMACPMMLHVVPGDGPLTALNWCARLVPDSEESAYEIAERIEKGGHLTGALRLCADTGQQLVSSGGFGSTPTTAIAVDKLGKPDANGGWTVGGKATIQTMTGGHFGCALFGMMPGIAVAWAAVSQSR